MNLSDTGDAYLLAFLFLLVVTIGMGTLRNLWMMALFAGIAGTVHFYLSDGMALTTVLVVIFTLVALGQLVMQFQRARRGFASADEQRLVEDVLAVDEPSQQRRLLDLLEWRDIAAGEIMAREGQAEPPMVYIATGSAAVTIAGQPVGNCGPGEFVGEMSAVAGDVASATVTASEEMRVALIDRDAMLRLTQGMPELGRAFDRALNRGLAAKVKRMNEAASREQD